MRQFARRALEIAVKHEPPVRSLTCTIHGVGYGLDAGEALQNLLLGFRQALIDPAAAGIADITFVEREQRRARLLEAELGAPEAPEPARGEPPRARGRPAGREPAPAPGPLPAKEHVFVAMPFTEEFQDVYEFGIYGPLRRLGFICEKVDETSFAGDILQRILDRIRGARFVVADLTQARPNVYLEVGYAWGHQIPVLLLARDGEKLHFDVATHRCLFYRNIRQLAKDLEKLVWELYEPRGE
jgi:hypothetical protein